MNPPLSFTNALTQLKTLTSQTGNFTFTDDELTQALEESWNDPFVIDRVYNATLSYSSGTFTYAIPTGVTTVRDIYFQRTSTDNPELLGRETYEVIDGNIIFNITGERWLGDNYQLFVRGTYKLTTSDSLDTTNLVTYVLNLAAEKLLSRLLLKKTFVFLTNDTSVAEISAALNIFQNNVLRAKQGIAREFEAA